MVNIFLIKNDSSGDPLYKFQIPTYESAIIDAQFPITPAPLPEEGSDENVLIKLTGNTLTSGVTWTLKDYDTNQETLAGIATKTVQQQINFFRGLFASASIEDSFQMVFNYPTDPITLDGALLGVTCRTVVDKPLTWTANAKFIQGNTIAVYETDSSTAPLSVSASSPATGSLTVDWSTPADNGTSAITGYRVSYRLSSSSGDFTDVDLGVVLTTTITSLTAGDYNVKVAAITSVGTGVYSILQEDITVT